jgi:hypothetical protein
VTGLGLLVTAALTCGCATQTVPVALQYQLAANEEVKTPLSGVTIGIAPFQDSRTDPYLYGRQLVLAEGQNAGFWVSNALKAELEHAGATVTALPPDTPPNTGRQLVGQVAVLRARGTGWAPGGIIAAIIGTGYAPQITLSVRLLEEGVPLLARQYDLQKNVPSDAFAVLMVGRPGPGRDVPVAFSIVLKNLIREQILPDIAKAIREEPGPAAAGSKP